MLHGNQTDGLVSKLGPRTYQDHQEGFSRSHREVVSVIRISTGPSEGWSRRVWRSGLESARVDRSEDFAGGEVCEGCDEGEADETSKDSMSPLHVEDGLEFRETDRMVDPTWALC